MNIGIVGAGTIAQFLLKEINQNGTGEIRDCNHAPRKITTGYNT